MNATWRPNAGSYIPRYLLPPLPGVNSGEHFKTLYAAWHELTTQIAKADDDKRSLLAHIFARALTSYAEYVDTEHVPKGGRLVGAIEAITVMGG